MKAITNKNATQNMTPILLDYQTDALEQGAVIPSERDVQQWLDAALAALAIDEALELTLRLVEKEEIAALNRDYRGKDYATNVLSFPVDWELPETPRLLGDIIIAAAVVNEEAEQQGKSAQAHWAHLCIHGLLHLLGYDHIEDEQADIMENAERRILAALGFPDPYTELED